MSHALEIWGGVECTVVRIGDAYSDQTARSGHSTRLSDLDLFASLRIRALRYPVLWETTAPGPIEAADWSWAEARLHRLRELAIEPIVGLVHHGSGPHWTSLVSDSFVSGLAEYARAVARRFPWVRSWTPVNEPLTTARFSGLYGHWYPHGRDDRTFARALVVQTRAVIEAMRAIREVIPDARLVQTEDMGKTVSTPLLAYQAAFENERRWLGLDLLCGRIDRGSTAVRRMLESGGLTEEDLRWFVENACPPDVLGLNYYITSDRLLDERMERYPAWSHGGNGTHSYADVESARAWGPGITGQQPLLLEAWERYRRPVAITEAHLGGTREEQVRWLVEAWEAARQARAAGADVRAVTAWSLLGAFDWNSLLVRHDGFYEPGVFDLRAPRPRATALAEVVRSLATTGTFDHPVLDGAGWWRRETRLQHPAVGAVPPTPRRTARPRRLLVTGRTGTLGQAFGRLCDLRGLPHELLSRKELDIADPASIDAALDRYRPWAIVNTAGFVRVDEAESCGDRCRRENAIGPALLAERCAKWGVRLVTFSSDLVFDGTKRRPYIESDPISPLNEYGRSKAEAERAVLGNDPRALVVRTSAFFGPWDQWNFVHHTLAAMEGGRRVRVAADAVVSPTYVPDLVHACLDLLVDGASGLWHLANAGAVTWAELARRIALLAGLDPELVVPVRSEELALPARRPAYSALASEKASVMPTFERSLERYMHDREIRPMATGGGRTDSGTDPVIAEI